MIKLFKINKIMRKRQQWMQINTDKKLNLKIWKRKDYLLMKNSRTSRKRN
jgi:hypothetical protein